jgi:hypothetical protein
MPVLLGGVGKDTKPQIKTLATERRLIGAGTHRARQPTLIDRLPDVHACISRRHLSYLGAISLLSLVGSFATAAMNLEA